VYDEYALDADEKIRTLKRTINLIPEHTREEQLFVMKSGRAIRQRSTYRELRSGRPTQKRVDWFEPRPVLTSLQAFPFSRPVGKQQSVWSSGEVCVADSEK
jgi:hypothetical protein